MVYENDANKKAGISPQLTKRKYETGAREGETVSIQKHYSL